MANETVSSNFIKNIIIDDLETGKHKSIVTRFPPEPNGYLHIGHAKSICLNFGLAKEFIKNIIIDDLETGKHKSIVTRFPPEPNGYLHIGHAKSICLNFGLAKEFGGKVNMRFDDTNPTKEDVEYVDSIKNDVNWLGFNWDDLFLVVKLI